MRTPYILSEADVELIDPTIPPKWSENRSKVRIEKSFPEFLTAGFWENSFENELEALNTFDEVIVPIDKTWIAFSDLDSPDHFNRSNILLLLQNRWCPFQTAIDLAILRIQKGGESAEEIELAGACNDQRDELRKLVSGLSQLMQLNTNLQRTMILKLLLALMLT